MVGKRNEGDLSRWRISSNFRGLLKRKQELSSSHATQSSAGQGSSLQGRLSLVMEMSHMQILRVQDSMQWVQEAGRSPCIAGIA